MGWRPRAVSSWLLHPWLHPIPIVAPIVHGIIRGVHCRQALKTPTNTSQQVLWNNAQHIAATYPTALRSTYQAAATTLRIPYWDWGFNSTMPDVVNIPRITVNGPQGPLNITNPLYSYTFHPQPSSRDFPPTESVRHLYRPASPETVR